MSQTVFLLPGQGAQYYGMGESLYGTDPRFKFHMDRLDRMASDLIGASLVRILYHEKHPRSESFDRTLYTHPAIFMVECALASTLMDYGIAPDFLMGISLGEFVALSVSGAVEEESAFEAVITHGKIMEERCRPGAMIGIIDRPALYETESFLNRKSALVGANYDNHFVISGDQAPLGEIAEFLEKKEILFQELSVSHGFHSANMDPAEEACRTLCPQNMEKPGIATISCLTGERIQDFGPGYFWQVVREPIRFRKALNTLFTIVKEDIDIIDIGPAGTYAGFVRQNRKNMEPGCRVFQVMNPFGSDVPNLEKLKKEYENRPVYRKTKKEKKMKALVFPGQGSQRAGMGEELFDAYGNLVERADDILGYSVRQLCLENPENRLNNTRYTQPALFVVNALSYLSAMEEAGAEAPAYVAGHSLGEYNALFAAGVLDFETGLRLVKRRGELMAGARNGGMAAVIGVETDRIRAILLDNGLDGIEIANLNSPSQVVVSGEKAEIERAVAFFESESGARYVVLNVSGAFHSRLMADAGRAFQDDLNEFTFSAPEIPVISNVLARPYPADGVGDLLARQLTHPVKWMESVCYMWGKGVSEFVEMGPGRVLTGLITAIQREAEPLFEPEPQEEMVVEQSLEAPDVATPWEETDFHRKEEPSESLPEETVAPPRQEAEVESSEENPAPDLSSPGQAHVPRITAASLGSRQYKGDYNLKYAYATGGMVHGIASAEMVVKMGRAGMIGYFGTGALSLDEIERAISHIQTQLSQGEAYGINLMSGPGEDHLVDLLLRYGVPNVEAAAYMQMTPALVKYRLSGLDRNPDGTVRVSRRIMGKLSRPEVAAGFLSPPPPAIVEKLVREGAVTSEQAELGRNLPMADDICVEADSGGHTDMGVLSTLMPAITRLRDETARQYGYEKRVRIGAAGGIGTPDAAAAAFMLGADFILTGSINQCTVEAGTSDLAKDLLQETNVQDTTYAPAGDMFEMGSKVQVLKRGVFFPARANKLYELYRFYNSLEEIDEKTRNQLENKYFKRSFDSIWEECKRFYPESEIRRAENNPKQKMAFVFRWYFHYANRLALEGAEENRVDFQVCCGPALGAFNQWVKGTELENWRNRHVDEIAAKLLHETAELLAERFNRFLESN